MEIFESRCGCPRLSRKAPCAPSGLTSPNYELGAGSTHGLQAYLLSEKELPFGGRGIDFHKSSDHFRAGAFHATRSESANFLRQ